MKHASGVEGIRSQPGKSNLLLSFRVGVRVRDSQRRVCPDSRSDSSKCITIHRGGRAEYLLTPPHTLLDPTQLTSIHQPILLLRSTSFFPCRRSTTALTRALLQSWTCRLPIAPQASDDHALLSFHFAAKAGARRHPRLPGRDRIPLFVTFISRIPPQIRRLQPEI